MKLTFRQGIARYQTDVLSTPTFLQKSTGAGTWVDLIVAPDPTIIAFAHRSANYIVEEVKTVIRAWGPFTGTQTIYLYWDINLLTGGITRGSTVFPPIYAGSAPSSPSVDQHWFDTTESIMRVWGGTKWLEKIRVFAAYLSSGSIIRPYALKSQAGINGDFEGGNLVLDAYNKPLRQSDGSFVTSVTSLIIVNNAAKKVKFEAEVISGMAQEPIPKFHLVQVRPGRRLAMARFPDYLSRIAGITSEDLYTNEVGFITTEGLIRNENWSFPANKVGRPVFCGANGEVTTVPPTHGVSQIAGFVYDTDSIYMDTQMAIILEDLTTFVPPTPVPPPPLAPIANFYVATTSGAAPFVVNFLNTSTNNPTSYEWDFTNDGTVDNTTLAPSYTYAAPGTYSVRLRAINAFGSDDEVKTGYVTVGLAAPVPGANTNLGVKLGGPSQTNQNKIFQVSISVTNDGYLTATNVVRTITIPDLKGTQIVVTNLPPGSSSVRNGTRLVITMPAIGLLSTGSTYGPVFFNVTAPPKTGTLSIYAAVSSPEIDSTLGDNSTSIAVEVRA